MWQSVRAFGQDESGSMPVEWAFLATILVLGAITGALTVRNATLAGADEATAALCRPAAGR